MAGSRRARTAAGTHPSGGGDAAPSDQPERPKGTAKDRALRLLGVRWRSREELRRRLARLGYPPDEIDTALIDLEAVGLVDDDRFAREVVRDQAARRLAGERAIRSALFQRGVARDQIDRAVLEAGDEADRALELANRQAARLRHGDVATAHRRIMGQLLRRGYDHATAREATRQALEAVMEGASDLDRGLDSP